MNHNRKKVRATFARDTRFEVKPIPVAPYRALQQSRFESLKTSLLKQRLAEFWEPRLNVDIRRAANEAAALAWLTAYPLLVFPALFDEKAETALAISERQDLVRKRTREVLAI